MEIRKILFDCFYLHMNMRIIPYVLTHVCCLFISQEIRLLGGVAELMSHVFSRDNIVLCSMIHYLIKWQHSITTPSLDSVFICPTTTYYWGGNIHTPIPFKFLKFFTRREDLRNVVQQNLLSEGWDNIFIQLKKKYKRTKKTFSLE